jgi:HAMP domain-containing protein
MDWKSALGKQGLRLMQDPRVARLMQDERVMKAAVQALQMRGRLQQQLEDRVDQVAGALNLATKREIRELKRSLRRMEQELERARAQSGSS